MAKIQVCALSTVNQFVQRLGSKNMISLLSPGTKFERPRSIPENQHLHLVLNDISAPTPDSIAPNMSHIESLIAFSRLWDQRTPLIILCYAGVSRSTAAAIICACVLNPNHEEVYFAQAMRLASPTATPNPLMIAIADQLLNRQGRLIAAVHAMGIGKYCLEGIPFSLTLD